MPSFCRHGDAARLSPPEWVQHLCAQARDACFVAGDQRQSMDPCRGREQAIDCRYRTSAAHAAPFVGDGAIDRENAPIERRVDRGEPGLEGLGLRRVTRAGEFDALADFAEHKHAEMEIAIIDRFIPGGDVGVASLALAYLGDDVGVDQEAHRSTLRPVSRTRSRSIPSSGAAASNALRPLVGGSLNCCFNKARAAVPRAGSRRVCATRRTKAASSRRTWTSTRTTP